MCAEEEEHEEEEEFKGRGRGCVPRIGGRGGEAERERASNKSSPRDREGVTGNRLHGNDGLFSVGGVH